MKQTNISIFIPHLGCPHRCSFCDQRKISGETKPPRGADVKNLLAQQAEHLVQKNMTAEIAFFGGSFTAIPRDYMTELLEVASEAVREYPAYTGIRCSTRPDCIDDDVLSLLKSYGMTAVELGAQSMSDEVLTANERGHSAEDIRRASALIKSYGIELGLQMMTGLYKDTADYCRYTAREFIKLSPATVRIYPTVILRGTRLGALFESGEYSSFSQEETIELCAQLLKMFDESGIKVIRMGLHASEQVEREMLGGVYHPAFRELCESRLFLNDMKQILSPLQKGEYVIYTDGRNISKAVGNKRGNILALAQLGYNVTVRERSGEYLLAEQKK
ncbi:MAG: elongator complex protein 3 [Oscillospiraceae bacterium]